MNHSMQIFDRKRVRANRNHAALDFSHHDFLVKECCERLADRLEDVQRSFPLALDLGCHNGEMATILDKRGGIETLVQCDLSEQMLRNAQGLRVASDEEWLPFKENSFDLVLSAWSLHWVNDLPGALIQIRRVLKPDGLFIAILPGGQTLQELRDSFTAGMIAEEGGISPRISPFIDVRDAGALLQRAGFSSPVVDSDLLQVMYEHPVPLLNDLRGMGETNALLSRQKHFTRRNTFRLATEHYLQHYKNEEGRITASFELVAMTGWKATPGH